METEEINLLVVPIKTLLHGTKYIYKLADSTYGEWIIYQGDEPTYYLNIFDPKYDSVKNNIKAIKDTVSYLEKKFELNEDNLKMERTLLGIPLESESFLRKYTLKKLPVSFFND